jgi:dTMP kinase
LSAERARGRFVTLEGGEGAGKSTQARRLVERLTASGVDALLTREPGGSPGAERLRDLLLNGPDWDRLAEAMLHAAARADHVGKTIRPALEEGRWVVCDRFTDSTMAYQGYGQDADRADIATLAGMIGLVPDLTLILDVPVETALARMQGRAAAADRYERLGPVFFERVNAGFRAIAAADPERCVLIAADAPEQDVAAAIAAAVQARLGVTLP